MSSASFLRARTTGEHRFPTLTGDRFLTTLRRRENTFGMLAEFLYGAVRGKVTTPLREQKSRSTDNERILRRPLSYPVIEVSRTRRDSDYYQAAVNCPLASCQCGVQARATSLTAMFALVGLIEIVSSFSCTGSVAADSASLSDLNCESRAASCR